jgi:hypothetical protein
MVKKSALIILLLCMTCAGWAAESRLTVKVDKKTSVLGEPVLVEIKAEDVREPLSSISLEKLKTDFNVYGISSSSQTQHRKGRTVNSETMSLTLYPLRSGKLNLPGFNYHGSSSKAIALTITASGKKTAKVIFKTVLDTPQPQVRQAATLTLDIYDDGTLQWTAPHELVAAGAHQRRLAESQSEEMLEGKRYTVHRFAWALMPLREGKIIVEFPMLDAFKFGTRLRYPLAPLRLNAAAVPAYLPVYVPIGQLLLAAEPLPGEIALGRPVNLTFTVQGSGISEEAVGKLLSAVHGNEMLRFYPPVIGPADNERSLTASQKLRVTLPFVAVKTGPLQLPEINFPYFDPASARVESVSLEPAQVEVFNPMWRIAQKISLGLLVLSGLSGLGYWLYIKLRSHLHRRKVLLLIRRAASAGELHGALLKFAGKDVLMQNSTLQQWLQHMQQFYYVDDRLAALVLKLEVAKYADEKNRIYITELAHEAVRVLSLCRVRSTRHGA